MGTSQTPGPRSLGSAPREYTFGFFRLKATTSEWQQWIHATDIFELGVPKTSEPCDELGDLHYMHVSCNTQGVSNVREPFFSNMKVPENAEDTAGLGRILQNSGCRRPLL